MRKEDIVGYLHGTSSATPGLHSFDEEGSEYIFSSSDGNKYKLFNSGDKVLNAKAAQFLYDFATAGSRGAGNMMSGSGNVPNNISNMNSPVNISMGDIVINGSANEATVSEIRRAQRENINYVLQQLNRLNK